MEEATRIKEVRNTVLWTYVVDDLNGEEIVGTFCEKELQKTNEKEFRLKKQSRKKAINYMLNGKETIFRLIAG